MEDNKMVSGKVSYKKYVQLRIICIVFLIASILVGAIFFGSVNDEYKLNSAESADDITNLNQNLTESDIVEIKELIIVDKYAVYGNENNDKNDEFAYYLAAFNNNTGGEEKLYYCSVCYDVGSEEYNRIEEYVNDDSQAIGDLTVPVCAVPFSEDDKAKEYYADAMNMYNEILGEEIPDSNLRLKYAFDTSDKLDEYEKDQSNLSAAVSIGAVVVAVLCIIGIIVSNKNIRSIKKNMNVQPEITGNSGV